MAYVTRAMALAENAELKAQVATLNTELSALKLQFAAVDRYFIQFLAVDALKAEIEKLKTQADTASSDKVVALQEQLRVMSGQLGNAQNYHMILAGQVNKLEYQVKTLNEELAKYKSVPPASPQQ
jgi:chromosome segregation ATPase